VSKERNVDYIINDLLVTSLYSLVVGVAVALLLGAIALFSAGQAEAAEGSDLHGLPAMGVGAVKRGSLLLKLASGDHTVDAPSLKAGVIMDISGLYIEAKAILAQHLILKAWDETAAGSEQVRPWLWADTWPLAKLTVERMGVEMMVLAGASGRTLVFGPGHLEGTASLGDEGHSVISGHRDTHIEFLNALQHGDRIDIELPNGQAIQYVVIHMDVYDQDDAWILNQTGDRLTLITCYPFHSMVPGGPGRYVVFTEKVAIKASQAIPI